MKKSLIALAVLAASGAAMAQSSVTLYGVADAGVTYVNGGKNFTGVESGQNKTSRLGFKGVEDLGGGLKANFVLEGGLNLDSGDGNSGAPAGAAASTGFSFQRQSTVGLSGGFGEVRLGRELTAAYNATARYDVFGSVGLGASQLWANGGVFSIPVDPTTVIKARSTTDQRVSNAVTYVSPDFAGFKVGVNYGFGEVAGANSDNRYMGAAATYDNGPISLGFGLERMNKPGNALALGNTDAISLGGSYDLGVAKLLAGYRQSTVKGFLGDNTPNLKTKGYMLAVTAPVGPGLVRASYNRYEARFDDGKTTANHFSAGYVYNMSKRTALYGTYSYLKNSNEDNLWGISSKAAVKDNGSQQGLQVGVTHAF
ncbi:porin [Acidovorax sp. HDW3]|uniref:porin n=1 Tax=Acidovorax sp. HDW3 TaxID=2714923 RepID=UPI00140BF3F0|nr:porin [Acidovorax sp. HDW3]QIL43081.1 porin [Acidovorax sp. HDW3]